MAKNTTWSTAVRSAKLDAIRASYNSGYLRIYDGSQPAGPGLARRPGRPRPALRPFVPRPVEVPGVSLAVGSGAGAACAAELEASRPVWEDVVDDLLTFALMEG